MARVGSWPPRFRDDETQPCGGVLVERGGNAAGSTRLLASSDDMKKFAALTLGAADVSLAALSRGGIRKAFLVALA